MTPAEHIRHDPPACLYCAKPARLLKDSASLYASGKNYGPAWACMSCQAWVGCHDGTTKPLGRLANKELRALKVKAHAAFDPLWQAKIVRDRCSKKQARGAGYKWLAAQLGIKFDDCHIGMFDEQQCRRVIEICSRYRAVARAHG